MPTPRQRGPRATGERRHDEDREHRHQDEHRGQRVPDGGEGEQDHEAQRTTRGTWATGVDEPGDHDELGEEEREQREHHERAEAALRHGVARHRVHAVCEAGGERGPPEVHEPPRQAVGADRADRHRQHHHEGACQPDRTEQDGARPAHRREQRRSGRGSSRGRCSAMPSRRRRTGSPRRAT